jgi:hypothetical protein
MPNNLTPNVLAEIIDWASDCAGYPGGTQMSAERATQYAERHYPGGLKAAQEDFNLVANTRG